MLTSGTGQNTVNRASLVTCSKTKPVCELETRLCSLKTIQLTGLLDVRDFDVIITRFDRAQSQSLDDLGKPRTSARAGTMLTVM